MNATASHQQARQRAAEDLQDIAALAESKPFSRYWIRRMNDLHADNVNTALNGKTPEEREAARHRARLLHELTQLPAMDRANCEKFLNTPATGKQMPQQAG